MDMSSQSGGSRATIQRLIAVSKLDKELLDMVDSKKIGIRQGVDLATLPSDEQKTVHNVIKEPEVTLTSDSPKSAEKAKAGTSSEKSVKVEKKKEQEKAASRTAVASIGMFTGDGGGLRNTSFLDSEIDDIISDSGADETQEKVIRFALSKVGYPYNQDLRTSGKAYDCSSLAYYSWEDAGVWNLLTA